MGRTVYADKNIINYLSEISKNYNFTIGLVIGQCSQSSDYLVRVTRTILQIKGDNEPTESILEVNESIIVEHAKQVTRMLSGGFWILGIFVCSVQDVFQNSSMQSKLKSILYSLKSLSNEPLSYANSPSNEKLVIYYNPEKKKEKYICLSLNISSQSSSFELTKYIQLQKDDKTHWLRVSCSYALDLCLRRLESVSIKTQLKELLEEVKGIVDSAVVHFDGLPLTTDSTQLINQTSAGKDGEKLVDLTASVYLPLTSSNSSENTMVDFKQCSAELRCIGTIASEVYLHPKASHAEATQAVKQDILRTVSFRLEMHSDSLVEECDSEDEKRIIHEPPRRVLVPVEDVRFTEYLFPGETAAEVVSSFKELLDVEIKESDVEEIEKSPEQLTVEGIDVDMKKSVKWGSDPTEISNNTTMKVNVSSSDNGSKVVVISVVSFAVLFIAVLVGLFFWQNNN